MNQETIDAVENGDICNSCGKHLTQDGIDNGGYGYGLGVEIQCDVCDADGLTPVPKVLD
jgi:hypothetical protein